MISLIVTIIVLLILAGISIATLSGNNGIIEKTKNAKEATEISDEKDTIKRAIAESMGKNKYGRIEKDVLQNQLDKTKEQIDISKIENDFEIIFKKTNRYYYVDSDGNIGEPEELIDDKNAGDISKGGILNGIDKPYEINCIEDLIAFSNMVNGEGKILKDGVIQDVDKCESFEGKKVVLKRNLNFKSKVSYQESSRTDFGNINGIDSDDNKLITELTTGSGFIPIGQYRKDFKGDFDGLNHKIINLYEKNSGSRMGLFGCVISKNIENLYIQGNIEATSGEAVGGLCGAVRDTELKVSNCTSNINIKSKVSNTGGLIASSWTKYEITFVNCVNKGNIEILEETSGTIGGFIGKIENNANIFNSCNLGSIVVNGQQNNITGIAGGIGTMFSRKC